MSPTTPGMFLQSIQTPWGCFSARYSLRGLSSLFFPGDPKSEEEAGDFMKEEVEGRKEWMDATEMAVNRVLAGKVPKRMPPMDLRGGTSFQMKVWSYLGTIPLGEVRTYLGVAQAIGHPRASRAVGNGCGANPIPVLIPCHRVVCSGGGLGGFTAGLGWKERLLVLEGYDHSALV